MHHRLVLTIELLQHDRSELGGDSRIVYVQVRSEDDLMGQDDRKLIDFRLRRRQMGSSLELEAMFDEHRQALRAFVAQRANLEGVDVDDVTQEVFLKIASNKPLLSRLANQGAAARSFLFTMANNLIVDICRKLNVRKKYHDVVSEEMRGSVDLERTVIAERELEAIKAVILGLKPEWRETFVLNRFGGMSYREIAEHLDITVKQVENHMARSLMRIRKAQEKLG